jgi:hypothetical protein
LFNRLLSWVAEADYNEKVGNFRIFSRAVAEGLQRMPEQMSFFGAKMHWLGYSVTTQPIQHAARFAGQSTYTFSKLLRLGLNVLFSYSTKPLTWSACLGLFISICAFIFGTCIIFRALLTEIPVPGWASLMVSIYFVGGLLMTSIGILGILSAKPRPSDPQPPSLHLEEQD